MPSSVGRPCPRGDAVASSRCAWVTSSGSRRAGVRARGGGPGQPRAATARRRRPRWSPRTGSWPADRGRLPDPVEPITTRQLPKHFNASARSRAATWPVAAERRAPRPRLRGAAAATRIPTSPRGSRNCAGRCGRTRATRAPTARTHARWAERWSRLERETEGLRRKVAGRPTRWRGRSTGSARCSRSWATSGRTGPGHRAGRSGCAALGRDGPARGGVPPPRRVGGAGRPRTGGRRVRAGLRVAAGEGPMPRVPAGPVSEALADTVRLWAELEGRERRQRAAGDPRPGRRVRLADAPLGPRGTRWRPYCAAATAPRATSCAGPGR